MVEIVIDEKLININDLDDVAITYKLMLVWSSDDLVSTGAHDMVSIWTFGIILWLLVNRVEVVDKPDSTTWHGCVVH